MRPRAALLAIVLAVLPALVSACTVPRDPDRIARAVIDLTNALRSDNRVPALGADDRLAEAAQQHACYMARTGKFSHTGSGGSTVGERVTRAGYRWRFVAENIAFGQPDPQSVIASWQGSPGHRRNMLSRDARQIGIGIALDRDSRPYWVMVLAAPR